MATSRISIFPKFLKFHIYKIWIIKDDILPDIGILTVLNKKFFLPVSELSTLIEPPERPHGTPHSQGAALPLCPDVSSRPRVRSAVLTSQATTGHFSWPSSFSSRHPPAPESGSTSETT
jgi:hypothetical protein